MSSFHQNDSTSVIILYPEMADGRFPELYEFISRIDWVKTSWNGRQNFESDWETLLFVTFKPTNQIRFAVTGFTHCGCVFVRIIAKKVFFEQQ